MEQLLIEFAHYILKEATSLGGGVISTALGLFIAFNINDRIKNRNGDGLPPKLDKQTIILNQIKDGILEHTKDARERGQEMRDIRRSVDKIEIHVEDCPARKG
jgi:hypothetical protein